MALSDKERFPLITDLAFLNQVRQDEVAPTFNFQSGDRLNEKHLKKVKEYEEWIRVNRVFWNENKLPAWIEDYLRFCKTTVPFYADRSLSFSEQPTISRSDLHTAPWMFVSSESAIDDLLVYQTSGTTGPPMDVLFDPVAQACWIPQLQSVLDRYNIELSRGSGKVGIAMICAQQATLTYASLSTYLDGAGILKVNLNLADWKDPSHAKAFLEKYNPEVLTGDPFAFMALMELGSEIRPKVVVSSAMKLTETWRRKLENHFQCVVLDVYSLTECRMIAFADGNKHTAIRPDLYLEVFDATRDIPLPYGERGELVVTGGMNPFLALLRYRTGDFCSMQMQGGIPYLMDLEAREAVAFYTKQGQFVNSVDISRALSDCSLAGFELHQGNDYGLTFTGWSDEETAGELIRERLNELFGSDIMLDISMKSLSQVPFRKLVSYSSEFGSDSSGEML